jgi:hypothetical protein
LLLQNTDLLNTQLDAVFEAAKPYQDYAEQRLSLILPCVYTLDEVKEAKKQILTRSKHHGFDNGVAIGIMAETVPVVGNSAVFANETDLILYGTNDYTVELLGASRFDGKELKTWMAANDYRCAHTSQGIAVSPFIKFAPGMDRSLSTSIISAKRANPKVNTIICGDQVAEDHDSLSAAYTWGTNGVCVPASADYLLKTAFFIQNLEMKTNKDARVRTLVAH